MNKWPRWREPRYRTAWGVLAVSLALTLVAWYGVRSHVAESAEEQFELHVRDVIYSIEERLRQHEQILLGGEGLFAASEVVDRAEWRAYIERLHLQTNYSGILGVGYAQVIRPAELQKHIARIRAEGFPDYEVHPPGARPLYTAAVYLEPFSGRNLAAFGYDMMSDPVRAHAMRMAAETGMTAITGKVKLVQETQGEAQAGFLMYVPVYRDHRMPATPKEGWDSLRGFVYSPFRVGDLMAGILSQRNLMLDFTIFDGAGEASGARMYASVGERTKSARNAVPKMTALRTIQTYGRTWTLRLHSRPEFDARFKSPLGGVVLSLGGGVSVLLFILMQSLISRRERAEEMAQGMTEDIRNNEEKLRQSEMRIRAVVDGADHLIISTTPAGLIETFNRASERDLGYRAEEVIGIATPKLFLDADEVARRVRESAEEGMPAMSDFDAITARVRKEDGSDTGEWTFIRKDGSRFPVLLTITALRDAQGEISAYLGIATDISERKKMERMKTEFISTVSHELRTPLTSIRGALALVAGGVVGELPAAAKPLVEIAHKNSERLILLVNDLLDMEKIEAGKMELNATPVKLMPLLQQALEGNQAYAEQYQVRYELEGDLPDVMVNVDANRMMQVLANLLSNATKYSPAGGTVKVALERVGQQVRVAVKDNGPGIPEEFRSRIFQKFAQADSSDTRKKGGTGLGLSITKAIVEHMGGRIWFDSQPNVETVFHVEFPEWQEKLQPEIGQCVAGSVHRVLVCEDSRDTATVLRMMLEHAGYAVDIAYDASQAKQLLAQGGYAAMTLDLAMPGQSGISLIRELHEHEATAALPILVVSANAAEGRQELAGEEFSVVEWIDKPVIQERLLSALKGVAARSGRTRLKVLHVERDPDIFHVLHEVASEVAEVEQAANLAEARSMLAQSRYDLVILDLDLPDGSGKELLQLLRSAMPPIPVMVFSVYEIGAEEAKEVNAVLVKSRIDNVELLATIKRLIGAE